eukprot:6491772-Prymnesium_polylepis.3
MASARHERRVSFRAFASARIQRKEATKSALTLHTVTHPVHLVCKRALGTNPQEAIARNPRIQSSSQHVASFCCMAGEQDHTSPGLLHDMKRASQIFSVCVCGKHHRRTELDRPGGDMQPKFVSARYQVILLRRH